MPDHILVSCLTVYLWNLTVNEFSNTEFDLSLANGITWYFQADINSQHGLSLGLWGVIVNVILISILGLISSLFQT